MKVNVSQSKLACLQNVKAHCKTNPLCYVKLLEKFGSNFSDNKSGRTCCLGKSLSEDQRTLIIDKCLRKGGDVDPSPMTFSMVPLCLSQKKLVLRTVQFLKF